MVPLFHGNTVAVAATCELLVIAGTERKVGHIVCSVVTVLGVVVYLPRFDPKQQTILASLADRQELRAELAGHPPLQPAPVIPAQMRRLKD